MKKFICNAIVNAPDIAVSTDSPSRVAAERLTLEAESLKDLLWVLQMRYNSAIEPQASTYERVSRLRQKAIMRYERRKVTNAIEMYRSWNYTADDIPENAVYYNEIVAALKQDEGYPEPTYDNYAW